jgi:hypothetical protein
MRKKGILGILSVLLISYLIARERKKGFENGLQVGRVRTLIGEGYDLDEIADEIYAETRNLD